MKTLVVLALVLTGCGARGNGISFELGKGENQALVGPPFLCRIAIPHSDVGSLRQERAQLDRANEIIQFCAAQWETSIAIGR